MGTIKLPDITRKVCERTGYSIYEIKPIVDTVFIVLVDELVKGNEILIKNFGRFTLVKRMPRKCLDARNGNEIISNFSATIKFKMAKRLGDKLALLTDPKYDWGDDDDNIGVE